MLPILLLTSLTLVANPPGAAESLRAWSDSFRHVPAARLQWVIYHSGTSSPTGAEQVLAAPDGRYKIEIWQAAENTAADTLLAALPWQRGSVGWIPTDTIVRTSTSTLSVMHRAEHFKRTPYQLNSRPGATGRTDFFLAGWLLANPDFAEAGLVLSEGLAGTLVAIHPISSGRFTFRPHEDTWVLDEIAIVHDQPAPVRREVLSDWKPFPGYPPTATVRTMYDSTVPTFLEDGTLQTTIGPERLVSTYVLHHLEVVANPTDELFETPLDGLQEINPPEAAAAPAPSQAPPQTSMPGEVTWSWWFVGGGIALAIGGVAIAIWRRAAAPAP